MVAAAEGEHPRMIIDGTGFSASVASVAGAIRRAAQATGASFDYLLAAAKVESNLNPGVKATTSSASGLFQFIEQTWLSTLKAAGHALGYGRYADAIVQTPAGGFSVPDPGMRNAVLNLRNDPTANAAMAGVFTQRNGAELRERLGRPVNGGELYIAHFLGPGGAAKLIAHAANTPNVSAAGLFPGAAESNRPIFYDRSGRARSVGEVYSTLVGRFETARANTEAMVRQAPGAAANTSSAELAPDTAGTTNAFAMISAVPIAHTGDSASAFHSLFQTDGPRQPISPMVGALWGGQAQASDEMAMLSAMQRQPSEAPHGSGQLRSAVQDDSGDRRDRARGAR
jgi:hypothetical protein